MADESFVGYRVRVEAEYMPGDFIEYPVIAVEDEDPGCDFCLNGKAEYEVDVESVLGNAGLNVLYCHSCAKSAAEAVDSPDEWIAPDGKMYVACRQCGEVFDDLVIAHGHAGSCGSDQGWDVVTEKEAF